MRKYCSDELLLVAKKARKGNVPGVRNGATGKEKSTQLRAALNTGASIAEVPDSRRRMPFLSHIYLLYPSSPSQHLKFINLVRPIPQLLQHPCQLPLLLRTLLRAADRLIQARRPTHKHLQILLLRLRKYGLQKLFRDVTRSLLPALGGFVEEVESSEAVGVGVF